MKRQHIIDLHTHTIYSDGVLTPVELIDRARDNGVSVLSIADHDTLGAYEDESTFEQAKKRDIRLIPGVEISAKYRSVGIHVLGLFIDHENDALHNVLKRQHDFRIEYMNRVVDMFEKDGWAIASKESLLSLGSITKAHISQSIVEHEENFERLKQLFGQIPNRGMFIEAMMNEGCKYFLERETLSPAEAIQAIHDAHGVAIFAHPIASLYEDTDMTALRDVISNTNFDALEAFYYYHDQSRGGAMVTAIDQMTELAQEFGLAVSAGSDYHGPNPAHGRQTDVGFKGMPKKPGLRYLKALEKLALKYAS